eukprot:5693415-Alexandrium_andersonii.AAC.1
MACGGMASSSAGAQASTPRPVPDLNDARALHTCWGVASTKSSSMCSLLSCRTLKDSSSKRSEFLPQYLDHCSAL